MVAGFAGAASAVVALFRRGDRTILVWLALVPSVLISLFWLAGVLIAVRAQNPMVWQAKGVARAALIAVQVGAVLGFLFTVRGFRVPEFFGLRAYQPADPGTTGNRLAGGRFHTDGIYARCRHPLYFFTALFFSAWPTMDLRALIFAIWLWLYAYVGSLFEERKLVAQLGEAYVAYRARTPRLLPFGRARRAEKMQSETAR